MLDENERLDIIENKLEKLKADVDLIKFRIMKESLDAKMNLCPICGNTSEFLSAGNTSRKNVKCPHCYSLERHRLVWLFFQQRLKHQLEEENIKLLHFAPERVFYNYFTKRENIDYYTVDINPKSFEARGIKIRKKVDMQDIPFPDNEFDIIYASHVLEHVPDDIKAMSELYRVLNPKGSCVLLVPLNLSLKETLENEEYNTPELRRKYYAQEDHLRYYTLDIQDRLESVGFNVETLRSSDIIESEIEHELYRTRNSIIFLCKKEI